MGCFKYIFIILYIKGTRKKRSKTYTKAQLEGIIGSLNSTPTDNIVNGIAGIVLGQTGVVIGLLGIGQATFAMKEKKKYEAILNKAKNSSSITIQIGYRYI